MGQLKTRMAADLKLAGLRSGTQAVYLRCAERLAEHYMRSPAEMNVEDVRAYLLYLVDVRQHRPATQRVHLAALKFLFEVTLKRPEVTCSFRMPKLPPPKLPEILSGSEVRRLFEALHSLKYKALVATTYGAGLRVSEVCRLQVGDIDSDRMMIHVRDAKGGRERYVMLSSMVLELLREYWRQMRPAGPYLFPGQRAAFVCKRSVYWALRAARAEAGITKRVTPHILQ